MYQFESRVRFSEVDAEANLTLLGVLDYFQDCATFHSEDMNIGIEYLKQQHLVWVLLSWQIIVDRYPKMGEMIVIKTMPYEIKGCFGHRNFVLETKEGERLAYANSVWSLIDTEYEKPARPTEEMLLGYVLDEKYEMEYAPRKIKLPKQWEVKDTIEVKEYHLDTNLHVNNGQYTKIAMEFLPKDRVIGQLRAEYKKQARLGDQMIPKVGYIENRTIVSLEDENGQSYAVVELQ